MKRISFVRALAFIGAMSLVGLVLACATDRSSNSEKAATASSNANAIVRDSTVSNDFRADLTTDQAEISSVRPTTLILNIKNARGEIVRDLQTVHEKQIHLILVSDDLAEFNHLHPEPQPDGSYRVGFTFSHGGTYRLYADFTPAGADQIVERFSVTASGAPTPRVALVEDKSLTKTVDGLRVTMQPSESLRAGQELQLNFIVADEATGKPVTDLQPYLGALAHFVIITEDTSKYLHVHPMEAGAMPGMGREARTGKMNEEMKIGQADKADAKVTISAHTTFPDAGLYKLWAQFQRNGQVIVVPFVVRVAKD